MQDLNNQDLNNQDGNLAQFFTPAAAAQFTWELTRAVSGCDRFTRVLDPAAGQGVFLDVGLENGWVQPGGAFGIELDSRLHVLSDLGEKQAFQLHRGDGLFDAFPTICTDSFDLVIGNPPFGATARVLPRRLAERMEALGTAQFRIGQPVTLDSGAGGGADGGTENGSRKRPARAVFKQQIEHLFIERSLQFARADGVIALILPEGFLANVRYQRVRDWVFENSDLLAVVGLPAGTFYRPGLNALTSVVILRKRQQPRSALVRPRVYMGGRTLEHVGAGGRSRRHMEVEISQLTAALPPRRRVPGEGRTMMPSLYVPAGELTGKRWDVTYWRGMVSNALSSVSRFSETALGDFVQHLTYGPIVRGERPDHVPGGIPVIRQANFGDTGLHLRSVLRVTPGGAHDPGRSRVQTGDLLLPRSGAGSLGRNRMAVYMNSHRANVGCFVDLIRLNGVNPYYVWLLLRSAPGWGQIRALINGVGTPNINFGEIRSLRIPMIPAQEQDNVEDRYRASVWPHHRKASNLGLQSLARVNFKGILTDLEAYLDGTLSTLRNGTRQGPGY